MPEKTTPTLAESDPELLQAIQILHSKDSTRKIFYVFEKKVSMSNADSATTTTSKIIRSYTTSEFMDEKQSAIKEEQRRNCCKRVDEKDQLLIIEVNAAKKTCNVRCFSRDAFRM